MAAISWILALAALGQALGSPPKVPRSYSSESGAFELRVEPGARPDRGPARCRLSRGGAVLWEQSLSFTFHDAIVTEQGHVCGYGQTRRPGASLGEWIVAVIEAGGEVRAEHRTPREPGAGPDSKPRPEVAGLFHDPSSREFTVRFGRGGVLETWRVFSTDTGADLRSFEPSALMGSDGTDRRRIREVRALPGTGLTLLRWSSVRHGMPRADYGPEFLTEFTLFDRAPRIVWREEAPLAVDRSRLRELADAIDRLPGILAVESDGRFAVCLPARELRVAFRAERDATTGTWEVRETGRERWQAPEPLPEPSCAFAELECLGVQVLQRLPHGRVSIPALKAFEALEEGRLEAVVAGEPGSFLLREFGAAGDLERERSVAFPDGGGRGSARVLWSRAASGAWLALLRDGEAGPRLFRLDPAATATSEIALAGLAGADVIDVAAAPDGGALLLLRQADAGGGRGAISLRAADGSERWSRTIAAGGSFDEPGAVAVLADGGVAVLCHFPNRIERFAAAGDAGPVVDLEAVLGGEPSHPTLLSAGPRGELLVADVGLRPVLLCLDAGGKVLWRGTPSKGARDVRLGRDGQAWEASGGSIRAPGSAWDLHVLTPQASGGYLDPEGRACICGSETVTVYGADGARLFDLPLEGAPVAAEGDERPDVPLPRDAPARLRFAASERWIAAWSASGVVHLYDRRTGTWQRWLPPKASGDARDAEWAFGFSADGRELRALQWKDLRLERYALPE